MSQSDGIIRNDELILVTGAMGFIGRRVVEALMARGFTNVRCLVRSSSADANSNVELFRGNLLSREDCLAATEGVRLIYHLAAGRGEKLFADAFLNSVVATRNLLDAVVAHGCLKRIVAVSSFAVYSNTGKRGQVLDENSPTEQHPEKRGDAYSFAKVKQDELVSQYAKHHGLRYVVVRPGYVYGPGNHGISGRVGLSGFGLFLHLGGSNPVPFSYVDNCAEAIVLAGLRPGVEGEVFNVVDDDLPTSRAFLRLYKRNVRSFRSIYLPKPVSYMLCWLWEKYSSWSEGQLPPVYNRKEWHAYWKKATYSNDKLKQLLGWKPKVGTAEGLSRYFQSCKRELFNA